MGVVVVEKSSTGNPATEGLTVGAAVVEEEAEIEEIIRWKKKTQCLNVSALQESRVMSEYSTKKTTQTGPSANYSEQ
jgi:hypothetical protein